jgi:hypothetical protein
MRATSLLRKLLDLKQTVVHGFEFTEEGVVVHVAPTTRNPRCGCCGRTGPGYDERPRRWRHLDFAGMRVVLEYSIRRVECARCGVTTELVPWAPAGSSFTYDFEHTVALFAQKTDKGHGGPPRGGAPDRDARAGDGRERCGGGWRGERGVRCARARLFSYAVFHLAAQDDHCKARLAELP